MKRAVIFANGELKVSSKLVSEIQEADLIIAADGGALHCKSLGIHPKVVIGDFDSLTEDELRFFEAGGAQLIRFPSHKDETDLELAFQYAQQQGCLEILLIGALGARWDMSIANILLAANASFRDLKVRSVDLHQEMQLIRSNESLTLTGMKGDTLSLIPLSAKAQGITTQGLEYSLTDQDLEFGSPRGVSNVFTCEQVTITLGDGLLICVVIRNGGIS